MTGDREKAKREATLAYLTEKKLATSGSFERGFYAGWDAALSQGTVTAEQIADAILDADIANLDLPFMDRRHEYARAVLRLFTPNGDTR